MDEKWRREYERVHSWTEPLLRRLEEEPRNERDRTWQEAVRANLLASRTIDDDLHAAGLPFTIGELGNVRVAYPEALPILLKHLELTYPEDIEGSILQALAVPFGGRIVFDRVYAHLRKRYHTMSEMNLYAAGTALAATAEGSDLGTLEKIIRTRAYGPARFSPLLRIAKMRGADPHVFLEFFESREEPALSIRALRLAKLWTMAPKVRGYLSSDDADTRTEARKFLRLAERPR